jgi:hypothetical protein
LDLHSKYKILFCIQISNVFHYFSLADETIIIEIVIGIRVRDQGRGQDQDQDRDQDLLHLRIESIFDSFEF